MRQQHMPMFNQQPQQQHQPQHQQQQQLRGVPTMVPMQHPPICGGGGMYHPHPAAHHPPHQHQHAVSAGGGMIPMVINDAASAHPSGQQFCYPMQPQQPQSQQGPHRPPSMQLHPHHPSSIFPHQQQQQLVMMMPITQMVTPTNSGNNASYQQQQQPFVPAMMCQPHIHQPHQIQQQARVTPPATSGSPPGTPPSPMMMMIMQPLPLQQQQQQMSQAPHFNQHHQQASSSSASPQAKVPAMPKGFPGNATTWSRGPTTPPSAPSLQLVTTSAGGGALTSAGSHTPESDCSLQSRPSPTTSASAAAPRGVSSASGEFVDFSTVCRHHLEGKCNRRYCRFRHVSPTSAEGVAMLKKGNLFAPAPAVGAPEKCPPNASETPSDHAISSGHNGSASTSCNSFALDA